MGLYNHGLKFGILQVEGLHYPCSENKGPNQLCGYSAADLRLAFCIYAKSRFSHDMAQDISVIPVPVNQA